METQLIKKAIALTGKTMEDVTIGVGITMAFFSIEKFCYYLLSPEFIEKYQEIDNDGLPQVWYAKEFGTAIYEYQKGKEQPLISLLEKICG